MKERLKSDGISRNMQERNRKPRRFAREGYHVVAVRRGAGPDRLLTEKDNTKGKMEAFVASIVAGANTGPRQHAPAHGITRRCLAGTGATQGATTHARDHA